MVRSVSIVLGIGLAILWIAGLSSPAAPGWLTWLDGVAALFAFGIAGAVSPMAPRSGRMGGPIALSLGLFALWIIGLSVGAVAWLTWWTFAFACAFLLLGIAAAAQDRTAAGRYDRTHVIDRTGTPVDRTGSDEDRPRRSA